MANQGGKWSTEKGIQLTRKQITRYTDSLIIK
jgi:hypothetical protein